MKGKICGVDEAGRGPVMGPLVVSGVALDDESRLGGLGIKDSKRLSPRSRQEIAPKIMAIADVHTIEVSAEDIDVMRGEMTLNEIEVNLFSSILEHLRPAVAYVDSADVNADRFGEDIRRRLDFDIDIVSKHKADDLYSIVGAASIIAKTTRDNEIEKIKAEIGEDIGSGYTSDPITMDFLEKWIRENHDSPPHARRSWETTKRIMRNASTKKLSEFER